jgi:peptidoglycan hydrolase CwlO-like protein
LDARIKAAQASINQARVQATALAKSIEEREVSLADKYVVFSERVRASYQRSKTYNPLVLLLSSKSASEFTREMAYRRNIERNDRDTIEELGNNIVTLEADKKKLEERQVQLAAQQKQLDAQAAVFRKDIAGAKSYQATLQGKINSLNAQQQSILAGEGFSPAFAAFSFGAPLGQV